MPRKPLTDNDIEKIREEIDDYMMALPHLAHLVRARPLSRKHASSALAKARWRRRREKETT